MVGRWWGVIVQILWSKFRRRKTILTLMLPQALLKALYGGTLHSPTTNTTKTYDYYFKTLDGVICGCSIIPTPSSSGGWSIQVTSFQGSTRLPTVTINEERLEELGSMDEFNSPQMPQQVTALFASLGEVGERLGIDLSTFPSCLPNNPPCLPNNPPCLPNNHDPYNNN
jgi:hypothetical protein